MVRGEERMYGFVLGMYPCIMARLQRTQAQPSSPDVCLDSSERWRSR